MLTTEQRTYFRFSVHVVTLISLTVGAVAIFTYIVSDRMLGYQHQMIKFHRELINGQYDHLKDQDLLIIGDSTAAQSLIPSEFRRVRAVSLASSAAGAIESYYLLREYLKKNGKPRCVLLLTSYGARQFHINTVFWPFIVGHGLLSYDQIVDYYDISKKLNEWPGNAMSPISARARIFSERFQYFVQFGIFNQAVFQPNLMFNHPQRSYRIFRRSYGGGPLLRRPEWLNIPFDGPNQEYLKSEFQPSPALDHYIQKILQLTKERGIRFYSDYGPVAASMRNETSSSWLRSAIQHIEGLIKPFDHAKSLLDLEWYVDTSFSDSTHLNWNAARKYSAKVDEEVSDCAASSSR
ncbi:MAG: hypothetical protein J0L82_01570 [Deltaproteobacteria bacterium]|jgi:hypothetical protein|nr:hypothetical protein [Deltaproteobacteria bacterium]